ncbi:MAG: SGNH/GDSL hydrolase family protein [Leifsonia sp.]
MTNRFAVGAQFSTALAAVSSLDIQLFADSALFMNAASQAVFAAQLLTGDLILPKSQSKQFMDVGDSITITSLNTLQGAGIREYKDQWIIDNRLSLNSIGQFVNGTIPNRECCGQGGADIATIKSNALAALSFPSAKPSAILLLWGTNNISAAGIVPTALAAFRSNLQLLWNAAVAKNPLVRIQLATITPINTSVTPASANALLFNIGLQTPTTGEFDVFAANNPGALLSAVDYAAAVGGAWSAPMFSPDNVHPNELGCQTIGAAQVLADGLFLRSLSATIRPLAVRIASPSTGASFASNVATNIQVNATRYPSTVQIKKLDGTVLGSATMTKLQGTFAWTPGAGNEGPQTLIAVVTDTLDSTIATSAGVAVTVTPAAYSPASEGNLGWWGDMQNVSSYTITGGTTVTSLKNVQTGVAAITGTAAPGYSAAGANGHPCLSLLAASSQNLICGVSADAAFTSAINGGSRTEFHVLSVNPTSAAGYFFTLANNSPTSAAEVFGAISSAYRTYHTSDANVTVSLNAPAVPDTALHIVRVRIDATANLAYISVDGGAESSGAFAQGSATNTRWGIGSTVGAAPGSFAGGLYAEGLVYTDLKAIGAGSACERVQTYLKAKWGTP